MQCFPNSACKGWFVCSQEARHEHVRTYVMVIYVSRGYVSILYFLSLKQAKKVLLRILRTILNVQTWLFHCVNSINFYKMVVKVSFSINRQILKLDQPLFSRMRPFSMFLTNQYPVLSKSSCLNTEVCRLHKYSRSQNYIYSSSSKSFSKTPSSLQNSRSVASQLWFDMVALTSFNFSLSCLRYLMRSITMPWIRAQVPSSSNPSWYLLLSYAIPKIKRFLCGRYTFDTQIFSMAN